MPLDRDGAGRLAVAVALGGGLGGGGGGHRAAVPEDAEQPPLVAPEGEEVDDGVDAAVEVHERHSDLQGHLEGLLLTAGRLVEDLPDHELDDVEVVGTEAEQDGQQHHQDDGEGPAVVPVLHRQWILLGRLAELKVDPHIAHQDDAHGQEEAEHAGPQEQVGQLGNLLEVEVLHARQFVPHPPCHGPQKQRRCLQEHQRPDEDADAPGAAHLPNPAGVPGAHHGDVAVHAYAGHEVDAHIGVHVEDEGCGPAEPVPEGPVKLQDVVGDPARQCQGEEGIGEGQVHQVEVGGVEFLLPPLEGDAEGQDVPAGAEHQQGGVEEGEGDFGREVVVVHVAAALVAGGEVGGREHGLRNSHFRGASRALALSLGIRTDVKLAAYR